jgi:hypothetical protein
MKKTKRDKAIEAMAKYLDREDWNTLSYKDGSPWHDCKCGHMMMERDIYCSRCGTKSNKRNRNYVDENIREILGNALDKALEKLK